MATNKEVFYLTLDNVKALHTEILELTNQRPQPLRDENALASAVMKPQWLNFYGTVDLIEQAAHLCVAISQAQAFVDGNKRTAFHVTDVFLRLNSLALPNNVFAIIEWLSRVAGTKDPSQREQVTQEFAAWMRQVVVRL